MFQFRSWSKWIRLLPQMTVHEPIVWQGFWCGGGGVQRWEAGDRRSNRVRFWQCSLLVSGWLSSREMIRLHQVYKGDTHSQKNVIHKKVSANSLSIVLNSSWIARFDQSMILQTMMLQASLKSFVKRDDWQSSYKYQSESWWSAN